MIHTATVICVPGLSEVEFGTVAYAFAVPSKFSALPNRPVVHVVLRRLDRREWVWLVVPAAAVVVSVGLYVAGIRRGGRDVLVNVISHVQIDPDRATARQAVAAGFFAPTRPQLSVVVPGDTPVCVVPLPPAKMTA